MAKSSIHIEPIKSTSESHNLRETILDYVQEHLIKDNYHWMGKTVKESTEEIKALYKKKVGQKMQNTAKPIREGVFLFTEKHTNEDLMRVVKGIEERFKIKPIQLHVHRDEGHWAKDENGYETKEWKPNLHAHIVFEWNDKETGKSLKLKPQGFRDLQTYFAESLDMERGVESGIRHLKSLEFKIKCAEEANKLLQVQLLTKMELRALKRILKTNPKLKEKVDTLVAQYVKEDKKALDKVIQKENEEEKKRQKKKGNRL